ncbi:MAG: hypothetical protein KGI52_14990 [Burkholderiales bacterium]|nr:hypothetical protein [Burkholderiales bacterium]
MNPLAFLSPYRWLIGLGLLAALIGGAWTWHMFKVREAVSAQKQADAAVLTETVRRINDATAQSQAQAQAESAQRAQAAQERINELQTAQAAVAGRAVVLARQLRELRAAESQRGVGLSPAPALGQEPRPDGVPGLSAPVQPAGTDPIDSALMARLTLAERLRQSCVQLWKQANDDRRQELK